MVTVKWMRLSFCCEFYHRSDGWWGEEPFTVSQKAVFAVKNHCPPQLIVSCGEKMWEPHIILNPSGRIMLTRKKSLLGKS